MNKNKQKNDGTTVPDPYITDEDTFWELESARLEAEEQNAIRVRADMKVGLDVEERPPWTASAATRSS